MKTGTITYYNTEKGYGFVIYGDDQDVFFHITQVNTEQQHEIRKGKKVEFEVGTNPKTEKPCAINIQVI